MTDRNFRYDLDPGGGGGGTPLCDLTETCKKGMVFKVFCLERVIYFITFCLKQGIPT